ncbi:retrotransposon gag domain-containing protein [Artemisia annua]|uniref:Retrotransposon gag domain-containing protein n=1 Tax=Artemisia annua TaxID=35608 RepID=A0A2U1LGZ4_ARTAN|nr:retrotransposon gag domain-containing protein [Artemisia annua]
MVDEVMNVMRAFIRGEVAVANQSKRKTFSPWKNQDNITKPNAGSGFEKKLDFKSRQRSGTRRNERFTPLTKTPKDILAMDSVKFIAPLPMSSLAENMNKNKFCEFHGDKGHNTDVCFRLKKHVEEDQGNSKGGAPKATKKGEATTKEKAPAIFMVQPW